MTDYRLYCCPPFALFSFLITLIAVVSFEWLFRQDNVGITNLVFSLITSVTDRCFDDFTSAIFDVLEHFGKCMVVVNVVRVTHHTDNDVAFGRGGY